MYSIIKTIACILIPVLFLTGCEDKNSFEYLIRHPEALKQKLMQCEMENNAPNANKDCEVAMYASANYLMILNEMQADPEKFGQKILDSEIALVKARAALAKTPDNLQLKTEVESRESEVSLMLAVAGIASPE